MVSLRLPNNRRLQALLLPRTMLPDSPTPRQSRDPLLLPTNLPRQQIPHRNEIHHSFQRPRWAHVLYTGILSNTTVELLLGGMADEGVETGHDGNYTTYDAPCGIKSGVGCLDACFAN